MISLILRATSFPWIKMLKKFKEKSFLRFSENTFFFVYSLHLLADLIIDFVQTKMPLQLLIEIGQVLLLKRWKLNLIRCLTWTADTFLYKKVRIVEQINVQDDKLLRLAKRPLNIWKSIKSLCKTSKKTLFFAEKFERFLSKSPRPIFFTLVSLFLLIFVYFEIYPDLFALLVKLT